ncbi:MAG: GAF domain-containing protein, partial [Cyanobacteria bacterium J06638_38]
VESSCCLCTFKRSTEETLGYVTARYEWVSSGTISQINHPELHCIPYDGIEDCYYMFSAGQHWGGLIETLAEPFRSKQIELGVKATYAIPIMLDGQYWGILGLDFCRLARQLEYAEIAVLKTAATCIGSAISRQQIQREQEQARCEIALAEQKVFISEERDRILKITTDVAQVLLNDESLDRAIASALKIMGVGINSDRVAVMEHHRDATGVSLGYVEMLYEWYSAEAIAQLHHPNLHRVSYEGLEDWYQWFVKGEAVGGIVEEFPEPVRSGQREIGVKSTYAVPIMVDGQYWGLVALDDCKTAMQRSETEIALLKTTAVCIGSAIKQDRVRRQQEQIERNILLEQQKATQLAEHNRVLEKRDRLLAATSSAANIISTAEDFDLGINRALKIIGEAIDTDRVAVIENWQNPSQLSIPHWRMLYEWNSACAISQTLHPEVSQGSWEGIEEWHKLLSKGQSIRYRLEEMPEPFRSGQAKLGVKVLYEVPIFVEGKYWGVTGFDDCREVTRRSEAELSILKTAAACIGGAIEKERSREAHERAIREKAEQLEASNRVLSLRDKWLEATANAANELLLIDELDKGIDAALKILGESLNCGLEENRFAGRVSVWRYIEDPTREPYEFVKVCYEWSSPDVVPQITHPELNEISAAGLEEWFAALKAGDWIGGVIEELKEPFKNSQLKLGVKATYAVPIYVNNVYWGAIGIDFCHEPRRLSEPEIAVFKTTASCLGSAIYRQQIQQEKEQAELAILDERNRMAREIHDTLAQAFTGISLQLEAAKGSLIKSPNEAQERLNLAKTLAKEGITEARRSVRALRPEALEAGLAIALRQLIEKMISGTDIKAQVIVEGKIRPLTPEIEVDLFRITQEAVTNSLRHAKASEIAIGLIYETDSVHLQIKDNGVGFAPEVTIGEGFGLIGIKERCDRLNCNLVLNSASDRGTEITVTLQEVFS